MSDQTPDLLIYGSPVSPFARKAMALAIEKGATHYAHVFYPLTGLTAAMAQVGLSP